MGREGLRRARKVFFLAAGEIINQTLVMAILIPPNSKFLLLILLRYFFPRKTPLTVS